MSRGRARVERALDALEHGDQRYAAELLQSIVEDRPGVLGRPPRCRICGQRAWPGEMRGHLLSAHDRHDEGDDFGQARWRAA